MNKSKIKPVVDVDDSKMLTMDDVETNIGNILLRLGVITEHELQCAVLHQRSCTAKPRKQLGQVLIERSGLDPSMLSHALEVQAKEREGDILGLVASFSKFVDGVAHRARSLGAVLDGYETDREVRT